jgi:hypothetical protein
MCGKIAVDDLVVGVARYATADCALWADDFLAFACDQHGCGASTLSAGWQG